MPTAQRHVSKGLCSFCKESFNKTVITRHLTACRSHETRSKAVSLHSKPRATRFFHLIVQGRYSPGYWMHLEIPRDATLKDLDQFLRDTWLECCGHLSSFVIEGERYATTPMMEEEDMEEESMEVALSKVLRPGMTFYHQYDYGSTTELTLRVLSEREGAANKNSVLILARNEPPARACESCGKAATQVCCECKEVICSSCLRKHACGSEMFLPLVNSPRTGVCGYTG